MPVVSYHQILLFFCHIVGMPYQDAAFSFNLLLYSKLSINEVLIQWGLIWINLQDDMF